MPGFDEYNADTEYNRKAGLKGGLIYHTCGGKWEGLLFQNAADQAIKGMSVGVIGTAFFAAVFSLIGFAIAWIHFKLIVNLYSPLYRGKFHIVYSGSSLSWPTKSNFIILRCER